MRKKHKTQNMHGFGDLVHHVIHTILPKIKDCERCEKRRKTLNRLFPFK